MIWRKAVIWMLLFCMLFSAPDLTVLAEEGEEVQETEESVPESYYYEIESNQRKNWPEGPMIEAASAVVLDMDTGTFLYSKQATEKMYPASTTKIMTTLLLIENCDLDETITFSEIVYDLEEGSSHLGIQPGEEMTLRDAAYGIMLASANDIANGVAEYIGGSISGFADMMNERAAEIGCVNTHFSNPHGLYSDDHYTCAYDMALIAKTAYENPVFREIVGTKEYTIPETNLTDEERSFLNHHKMLQASEEYYQDWCTGGKTGYTSQCLNTLVTFGSKDGMNLVSVVFRVNGSDKAYTESTQILEYAFDNFYTKNIQKIGSEATFYDIIGLQYAGRASEHLTQAWMKNILENGSIQIVLPKQATADQISYTVEDFDSGFKQIIYTYEGYQVGQATGTFGTMSVPAKPAVEKREKTAKNENAAENSIQAEDLQTAVAQAVELLEESGQLFKDFAGNHFLAVVIGETVLIVVLIVFFVLMIFRSTSDARIRRKRRQEEIQRQKREAEIEQMTTEEIEAELRMAMEQDRRRREQEQREKDEAERAARKEEEMELKAREMERLLDELEREQQERLARSKGINN